MMHSRTLFCYFLSILLFSIVVCAEQNVDQTRSKMKTSIDKLFVKMEQLEDRVSQAEGEISSRSSAYQALQQLAVHEARLLLTEYNSGASQGNLFALYTMLLLGKIGRVISFDSDVTVDTGHVFTVATQDNLSVLAPTSNPIGITSGSFLGVTGTSYNNLTLKTGATSTTIEGHAIVCGKLTVKQNTTVMGNLVVNGALQVDSTAILDVHGDLICDGQCAQTFVNAGIINATGTITVKNYVSKAASGVAVNNSGTLGIIPNDVVATSTNVVIKDNKTTGTDGITVQNTGRIATAKGTILFSNNTATGTDGVAIKNSGSGTLITAYTDTVTFENNRGAGKAICNESSAGISATEKGTLRFMNNESSSGMAILNTGAALIRTVDGNIYMQSNNGTLGAVVNMGAALIEATESGSIFIKDNFSSSVSAVLNDENCTFITTCTGHIVFEGNRGSVAGVSNMMSANITIGLLGSIVFKDNHSSAAAGVLNCDSATIETNNGYIIFDSNQGETVGVLNENQARIIATDKIVFESNVGRDDAGVLNKDGAKIHATALEGLLAFRHNTGRNYGVRNLVTTGSAASEIRTTDGTTSGNKTRILLIGNAGAICDTKNQTTGGTGSANIIAGGTGPTGSGKLCYDAQKDISAFGLSVISPATEVCAVSAP